MIELIKRGKYLIEAFQDINIQLFGEAGVVTLLYLANLPLPVASLITLFYQFYVFFRIYLVQLCSRR